MEQTSCQVVSANSSLLNSTTLLASPSKPNKVEATKAALVGKIPVVISEADIQVYVDATIQLEEPALDIVSIKKNVFLTRCQLLLTDDKKSAKLLISGYVRKNVQYSTVKHVGNTTVSGDIRFTAVNIPFKCFAKIDFVSEPVTASNPQTFTSSAISNNGMGSDQQSVSITNSEIFNEKIYCELIEAKIREVDIKKDIDHWGKSIDERTFKTFIESMVIELKLRVLQNQSVFINPTSGGSGGSGGKSGKDSDNECSGNKDKDCEGKGGSKGKEGPGEDKKDCDKDKKDCDNDKKDCDKDKKDCDKDKKDCDKDKKDCDKDKKDCDKDKKDCDKDKKDCDKDKKDCDKDKKEHR